MKAIQIVSSADENYATPLSVMLVSLLENKTSLIPIEVNIMDGGISEKSRRIFSLISQRYNVKINFLTVNRSLFKDVYLGGHVNEVGYYRICIPDLLGQQVDKVLYLDCDLVVLKDITTLWDIPLEDQYLAGCEDFANGKYRRNDLAIPSAYNYFNSGVMLINLQKWREDEVTQKCLHFIREHRSKIKLWDQDVLNAVLFYKLKDLDLRWNVQTAFFLSYGDKYKAASYNPYIIHFTGSIKPWHNKYEDPALKKEYDNYLRILLELQKGILIKGSGKAVYFYKKGRKHHIVSRELFECIGFEWGEINKMKDDFVNQIEDGHPIYCLQDLEKL